MMHKTRTLLLTCLAMAVVFALASCAPVYTGKVYTTSGKYNIASGGELEVLSGGVVDFQSGSYVTMSSGLLLDGGSDEVQLTVQGYITQTNPIMVVENQVGADIMTVASNTITMSGSIVGQGALDISGGDITLQNDETISNGTNNYVTVTLGAGTGNLGVATGNIKVGNGTESVTLNGEDLYVEGTVEADGAVRFDSTLEVNGDITLQNDETISNGYNGVITATATTFHVQGNETSSGSMTAGTGFVATTGGIDLTGGDIVLSNDEVINNSPNGTIGLGGNVVVTGTLDVNGGDITLANDETISNAVNNYVTVTLGAATGNFGIDTGNLKVGNGTETTALAGEDAYIEGNLEIDGAGNFDGALDVAGEFSVAGTAFQASPSGYITATNLSVGTLITVTEQMSVSQLTVGNDAIVASDSGFLTTTGAVQSALLTSTGVISGNSLTVGNAAIVASASGYMTASTHIESTGNATIGTGLAVTTGGIDISGGDLVLANDESIGNSANGTIAITATNLSLSNYVLIQEQAAQTITFNDEPITPTGTFMHLAAGGNMWTDNIVAGTAGQLLILTNDSAVNIVITDTGTIMLSGNCTLSQYDTLTLIADGTNWLELSTSTN